MAKTSTERSREQRARDKELGRTKRLELPRAPSCEKERSKIRKYADRITSKWLEGQS